MNKENKVFDISFLNIFTKKLMIRLIIFAIISVLLIISAQSITEWACGYIIENEKISTSLQITELVDTNIAKDKINMYSNVHLSQMQNELEQNDFIYNTSAAIYNMKSNELVARSQSIPVLNDEKALSWWRDLAMVEVGYPTISINNEMMNWINSQNGKTIVISKMYYTNFVLFPTELKAMENDTVVNEFQINTPSVSQSVYDSNAELLILGNSETDYAYKEIYNFRFIKDEDGVTEFSYTDLDENSKLQISSQTFNINETEYRLDVVYQVSFWQGAWLYVVLFELLGILICAGLAFINTKETLSMYH